MATDDSMSDDVFEEPEVQAKRLEKSKHNDYNDYYFQPTKASSKALNVNRQDEEYRTPSPSGYPGYKPPKEALKMYALDTDYYYGDEEGDGSNTVPEYDQESVEEGWKSYRIEEDDDVYDGIVHKVILLGDSGVGKTSLLVQYNTGEFKASSFSATVGIALTCLEALKVTKLLNIIHERLKLHLENATWKFSLLKSEDAEGQVPVTVKDKAGKIKFMEDIRAFSSVY